MKSNVRVQAPRGRHARGVRVLLSLLLTAMLVVASGPPIGPTATAQENQPDDVTITLVKEWFDDEGQSVAEPGVDWGVAIYTGMDDEVVASLPGDDNVATFEWVYDDGQWYPARYGVGEETTAAGWEAVACDSVDVDYDALPADGNVVRYNTSQISVEQGAPDGSFPAFESGIHLVCNQQLEAPDTVDVGLLKLWLDADGEVVDAPEADFEVTLSVDDEVVATVDESSPASGVWSTLDFGAEYVVAEPTLPAGWELATCPADVYGEEGGAVADGVGAFTADTTGRHFVCNQQAEPPFSDVPAAHTFFKEIVWAAEDGITTGYEDGTFRPGAVVTRQAAAAFIYRYAVAGE